MSVLTDFEFKVLEELAGGAVLGRADVAYLAGDQASAEVDPVMARFGRWRLAARGGSRRDPKWEATALLMRRFRVLEALCPMQLETSEIAETVGLSSARAYADLRWWSERWNVGSAITKSKKLLFFCAYCLDQLGEFIVITEQTHLLHSAKPHYLMAFHPRVRVWWRAR